MTHDLDDILLTALCPQCDATIAVPYGQIRQFGAYGCKCGALIKVDASDTRIADVEALIAQANPPVADNDEGQQSEAPTGDIASPPSDLVAWDDRATLRWEEKADDPDQGARQVGRSSRLKHGSLAQLVRFAAENLNDGIYSIEGPDGTLMSMSDILILAARPDFPSNGI
jgi:hypothetical protein